jgi:Protein of unknown function (DUF3224)
MRRQTYVSKPTEKVIVVPYTSGTFEVKITPEARQEADEYGVGTARFSLSKTFFGGLSGNTLGTMLSVGTPAAGSAAAYVAVDRFMGAVAGKSGGFVLIHRGTMSKSGDSELEVVIAPDSGTGELVGITGTLSIEVEDGVHRYGLNYDLPAGSD